MSRQTSRWPRLAIPVPVPFLVIGLVAGTTSGALRLAESPDEATATGIAVFFSVTIGLWLGAQGSMWLLHRFLHWTEGLLERLSGLRCELESRGFSVSPSHPDHPRVTTGLILIALGIYVAPLGLMGLCATGILIGLDFRVDVLAFWTAAVPMLIGVALFVLGIVIQEGFKLYMGLSVSAMERQLEDGDFRAQVISRAVRESQIHGRRGQSWARRFGGRSTRGGLTGLPSPPQPRRCRSHPPPP